MPALRDDFVWHLSRLDPRVLQETFELVTALKVDVLLRASCSDTFVPLIVVFLLFVGGRSWSVRVADQPTRWQRTMKLSGDPPTFAPTAAAMTVA